MRKFLTQVIKRLIFDNKCSVCKEQLIKNEEYICEKCFFKLKEKNNLKKIGNKYHIYEYDGEIRELLKNFKLKNRKNISKKLALLVGQKIKYIKEIENIDFIIPVPLNLNRYLERGFNQVEEILKESDIEFFSIERVKNTKYMYGLKGKKERIENLDRAFSINVDLTGKTILLVDDILTTGATIEEITREIEKKYIIKNIFVFTVALALKSKK